MPSVGCIHALDVKRRVGFGKTKRCGLPQSRVKAHPCLLHVGQNEIRCAVHDAHHLIDAVGGQTLAQGFDDGDAHGHSAFISHDHTLGLCRCKNLAAVFSQQRFIGRDHMLTLCDGFEHQRFGQRHPAHDFHHHINVWVPHQGQGIADQVHVRPDHQRGFVQVPRSSHDQPNRPPHTLRDQIGISGQQLTSARAHYACADQTDPQSAKARNSESLRQRRKRRILKHAHLQTVKTSCRGWFVWKSTSGQPGRPPERAQVAAWVMVVIVLKHSPIGHAKAMLRIDCEQAWSSVETK